MTGGYAQRGPQRPAQNGLVDLVSGNSRRQDLIEMLERLPDKESGLVEDSVVW